MPFEPPLDGQQKYESGFLKFFFIVEKSYFFLEILRKLKSLLEILDFVNQNLTFI